MSDIKTASWTVETKDANITAAWQGKPIGQVKSIAWETLQMDCLQYFTKDEIIAAYLRVIDSLKEESESAMNYRILTKEANEKVSAVEFLLSNEKENCELLKTGQCKLAELIGKKEKEIRKLKQSNAVLKGLRKAGK